MLVFPTAIRLLTQRLGFVGAGVIVFEAPGGAGFGGGGFEDVAVGEADEAVFLANLSSETMFWLEFNLDYFAGLVFDNYRSPPLNDGVGFGLGVVDLEALAATGIDVHNFCCIGAAGSRKEQFIPPWFFDPLLVVLGRKSGVIELGQEGLEPGVVVFHDDYSAFKA